jgi:hypothetical protein
LHAENHSKALFIGKQVDILMNPRSIIVESAPKPSTLNWQLLSGAKTLFDREKIIAVAAVKSSRPESQLFTSRSQVSP